jgi:hypothetical protein
MPRLQRTAAIFLISLVFPVYLWAAPAEMITIGAVPTGPTVTLCQGGTVNQPTQSAARIYLLDQPVWYTIHSPTATPSASLGALGSPGTVETVNRATDFRAVRQGAVDARAYIVCFPDVQP